MKTKLILFSILVTLLSTNCYSQMKPKSNKKTTIMNLKQKSMPNELANSKEGKGYLNPQPLPPKDKKSHLKFNALNKPLPLKSSSSHSGTKSLNPQPLPPGKKISK